MVGTIKARSELERRVALSLRGRTADEVGGIIREVCRIAEGAGDHREEQTREHYETVTGATAYERPATRAIDDTHLEMPFAGARKISRGPKKTGFPHGRHAAKALMDEMNVRPVCPKPNLPRPGKGPRSTPTC